MVGVVTVNTGPVYVVVPSVSVMGPVVVPAATVAVIWVPALLLLKLAVGVPLKLTPVTPLKLVPAMVTDVPIGPLVGAMLVMVGILEVAAVSRI